MIAVGRSMVFTEIKYAREMIFSTLLIPREPNTPIRCACARIHAPVAPVLACGTNSLSKVYKQGGIRRRPLGESRRSEMHDT